MDATIRAAGPQDVDAIQAIYAHHVLTGTGTFETEPPDHAEIRRRMDKVAGLGWPWLVACSDTGAVIGYAYAGPFRERAAYAHTVEDSIYVAPEQAGRGIGRLLLSTLIAACRAAGARQMLAVIGDSDNTGSIGLHRALGFGDAGVLRQVGHKFGRDLDVVIMQLTLEPAPDKPRA